MEDALWLGFIWFAYSRCPCHSYAVYNTASLKFLQLRTTWGRSYTHLPGLQLRLGDRQPPGKKQRAWGLHVSQTPWLLDLGRYEKKRFHERTADWYQHSKDVHLFLEVTGEVLWLYDLQGPSLLTPSYSSLQYIFITYFSFSSLRQECYRCQPRNSSHLKGDLFWSQIRVTTAQEHRFRLPQAPCSKEVAILWSYYRNRTKQVINQHFL